MTLIGSSSNMKTKNKKNVAVASATLPSEVPELSQSSGLRSWKMLEAAALQQRLQEQGFLFSSDQFALSKLVALTSAVRGHNGRLRMLETLQRTQRPADPD